MSDKTLYAKGDMVEVVDENGAAIPGMLSVPKAWLNTPLVPAGTKKGKPKTDGDPTPSSSTPAAPTRKTGEEPPRAGSGSGTAEWVAFAKEKGAKDEDLLDDVGEELSREALIAKFGTPSS